MALTDLLRFGGGGTLDPDNERQLLLDIANPPEKWIPRTATRPSFQEWLASKGPNYVDPTTGIVRGTTDNSAAYEYANEFFQLPVNRGDWLTMAPLLAAAAVGGVGLAGVGAGGAGAAGAAGAEGTAALTGAGLSAPVGTALATGAQEAAIADLMATGVSAEAATAAVMGGGETLSGVGTGLGLGGGNTGLMAGSFIPGIPNNVLAGVGQGVLGYLGADKVSDAYRDVANQNLALGAPYRSRLDASYQPGFDLMSQPGYADAFNRAGEISARAASAKFGNPAENPTAMSEIMNDVWAQTYLPALSNYRGQLGQFSGMGLNTSGAAQLGGAQNAGGGLDAIGFGLGTALNPQPNWQDIFRQMNGQPPIVLNIGGVPYGGGR